MNNSITRITLDVSVQAKQACISLRQFDTMRRIVFSIVDRGVPYVFEEGVYAYLSAKTSADTYVFGGTTIQYGAVHFDVPASMTLEEGEIQCELILSAVDHRILNTSSFDIIVFHSNGADYADDAIASNDFFAMVEATNAANDIARILNEKLENGEFKGDKGDKGDRGEGVPNINTEDEGKVLGVVEGAAEWVDAPTGGGGINITEITSPEEITADSPDGIYVKPNGSGGGGTGGSTTELEQTVARHTNQINLIANEIATINKAIGDDKDDLAVAKEAIQYVEQRVEANEESIRDLYEIVATNDEVVDLTGVFDFATSIMAGGAEQSVEYDCLPIIERLRKGAVKFKVKLADVRTESYAFANMVGSGEGSVALISILSESAGVLLWANVRMNKSHIYYRCAQVSTQIYNPS